MKGRAPDGSPTASLNDDRGWYTKPHLLRLNFCILSLVLFSSASGYDASLMNGLQALDQWQNFMSHPTGARLGFINAIFWLGLGISFPIAAWAANKYGRKLGIYFGYILLFLGVALLAGRRQTTFMLSRLFVGSASAWFGSTAPLLIAETAFPPHRGVASAMYMCGWHVGGIVAGFTTLGTRNVRGGWAWEIPAVLQLLLPILALPGFILSSESPRWLVSAGRPDEARRVVSGLHTNGESDSSLVDLEMMEITKTLLAEEETHRKPGYAEMLKTPGNRHRLFISITLGIFSQWSGNGVISYYLPMVLETIGFADTRDQLLVSACLFTWNLVFAVAAALLVDKWGRRPLFLASAAIMLVSYIIVTGLSASFDQTGRASTGTAVIPFLFMFFAGYDIALTPLFTAYPCEIWPYRLRSRGLTIAWVSGVIAVFFNTFVNPIALQTIGWRYYFLFILVLVLFGATAYLYYPETRGHTLEQMAVVFDGHAARQIPNVTSSDKVER